MLLRALAELEDTEVASGWADVLQALRAIGERDRGLSSGIDRQRFRAALRDYQTLRTQQQINRDGLRDVRVMLERVERALIELKDETVEPADSIDYEALKKEHFNLLKKIEKLASRLKKRKTYDELEDIAYDSGLEWDGKTMKNRDKANKGVLTNWSGPREDAHTYLSFLEAVERKSEIERLLEMVRLK